MTQLEKVKTVTELMKLIAECKKQGKRVIWTNGCFDIFHVGHVDYLSNAKKIGDILIIGLNSDLSVRRLKGEGRPVFCEQDRAKVLNAIVYVDYIIIFDDPSPVKLLAMLRPDVYIKGGDYTVDTINQEERGLVENYGGKIEIVPVVEGVSTSMILNKMLASN